MKILEKQGYHLLSILVLSGGYLARCPGGYSGGSVSGVIYKILVDPIGPVSSPASDLCGDLLAGRVILRLVIQSFR